MRSGTLVRDFRITLVMIGDTSSTHRKLGPRGRSHQSQSLYIIHTFYVLDILYLIIQCVHFAF